MTAGISSASEDIRGYYWYLGIKSCHERLFEEGEEGKYCMDVVEGT